MKKNRFRLHKNEKFLLGIPLAITTLIMVAMVVVILLNTYHLDQHLEEYAEAYSDDVAEQLTERISLQLDQKIRDVKNLADSLTQMPDEVLTVDFLKQREENLDINHLFILEKNGEVFPPQGVIRGFDRFLEEEQGLYESAHISFLGENQVIMSAPFSKEDSPHLLIAICSGQHLQKMIEDFNYEEEGRCCIIDIQGRMVVAPKNIQSFQNLASIFHDPDLSKKYAKPISSMSEKIRTAQSGWTVFQDIQPHSLIVGYDFLGVCDWMLLTVMPLDILSNRVAPYTTAFTLIAMALILVIAGIIFLLIRIYQKHMEQIRLAALIDPVTGGDNSNAFRIRCEYRINESTQQPWALVYMNNKDFRSYNSRFGIRDANKILSFLYNIIQKHLTEHELIARCDGTSFCLLLEEQDEALLEHRLGSMVTDIQEQLYKTYSIDNHLIAQGAYFIPQEPYDFLHMLDWAKTASTYNVKHEVCKIYDSSIVQIMLREEELDNSFHQAIKNHEFKLYIQPKVSPKDNRLLSGEVLVRWIHPKHGLIPPNDFIPLFERNGKICELDFYMFEETCRLLRAWLDQGRAIPLSVNLSRAHMGSHNFKFLEHFREIKDAYEIPDGLIELELTESMILERQEVSFVLEVMNRIRDMGFACSLDDFGYGFSSLTLLKDLNVNAVKLDRQFFLNENRKSWVVIEQLIHMAHQLEIAVVAEGIENWAQVDRLKSYHCDLIQGYVYSKPLDLKSFSTWTVPLRS